MEKEIKRFKIEADLDSDDALALKVNLRKDKNPYMKNRQ